MNGLTPGAATRFWRGARKKCPACGGGDVFERWTKMRERCPTCNLCFERTEGYFLGAFVLNFVTVQAVLVVVIAVGVVVTLPDPPVIPLTIVGCAVVALTAVGFYPFSKTLWSAFDLSFRPLKAGESSPPGEGPT